MIIGIFVIILFGTFLHFLYDLTNEFILFALISPVNESVFEHLKLPLLPTILYSIISAKILKLDSNSFKLWFASSIISFFINIIFITIFYYTYTGAFGIHTVILDISSFVLGTILGQLISYYIYINKKIKQTYYDFIFALFFIIIISFIVFTFKPPHLPIFKDGRTNNYGI